MLTDKQERFAQAYVLHRNATEAAKAAGYAERSAYNQGYRMLKNEEIIERISDLENDGMEGNEYFTTGRNDGRW